MFLKPFKIASNTPIPRSARKMLREVYKNNINPKLSEEEILKLIPKKEEMTIMKIKTFKQERVVIYCVSKSPIVFQHQSVFYPSLFATWIKTDLVKTLSIVPNAMEFLSNGADLMLPGVLPLDGKLPNLEKNEIIGIRVPGNLACVAIGVALMSSEEMLASGMRGKGVKILHVFGDHLWAVNDKIQLPVIPTTTETEKEIELEINEKISDINLSSNVTDETTNELENEITNTESNEEVVISVEEMDKMFEESLLCALKTSLKAKDFPMLTSLFYRVHMTACCPEDHQLNIKKSSYKKLNKFLKEYSDKGLLTTTVSNKGDESIATVNYGHSMLKSYVPPAVAEEEEKIEANTTSMFGVIVQDKYEPPVLVSMYGVNSKVSSLFKELGYKSNSVLSQNDVREAVKKYVVENELQLEKNIKLDPILHRIVYQQSTAAPDTVPWNKLYDRIFDLMSPFYQKTFPGIAPIITKGKIPFIEIKTEKKMGKKTVTIIKNLEDFGIDIQEFSLELRKRAQSGTSISSLPGKPLLKQLQVQGNKVTVMERMLTEQYKLNKKYIHGLEFAKKKI